MIQMIITPYPEVKYMISRCPFCVSLTGVAHSDDLIYLFPQPNIVLNSEDRAISRTMIELWTNFATYRYV
jgi:hypothetical protein